MFPGVVLEIAPLAMWICHHPAFALVERDGHHDDNAASVLGTVQGAALRSARACARPSGLDGACAQMIDRQLRDGRRILFPSGTQGASIDPFEGLAKRSRVVDRLRTRALQTLVEVHFCDFDR
jgi:hypothetical protein